MTFDRRLASITDPIFRG